MTSGLGVRIGGMSVYRLRDCPVLCRTCAYSVGRDVSVWPWGILSMRPGGIDLVRGAGQLCYFLCSAV